MLEHLWCCVGRMRGLGWRSG